MNLAKLLPGERSSMSPLDVALELGFHSLIEVLLDAGAVTASERFGPPIYQAISMRRLDIIKLLVEHGGVDPSKVSMPAVFDCWDPQIMEYFIERGADVEKGNPLAYAFSERIRTALRIFKQYKDRFPSFQEQANIALRYHCSRGDLKWVSLMLWAGADPYKPGVCSYDDEDDEPLSALGYAALHEHGAVFKLKGIYVDPSHPVMKEIIRYAGWDETGEVIQSALRSGANINDQENGGSSALQCQLEMMGNRPLFSWHSPRQKKNIDSDEARERLKQVHLLAQIGAKWIPVDRGAMTSVRQSLLKLIPDYTVEVVWIMSKYQACSLAVVKALLRVRSMTVHIVDYKARLEEILSSWTQDDV